MATHSATSTTPAALAKPGAKASPRAGSTTCIRLPCAQHTTPAASRSPRAPRTIKTGAPAATATPERFASPFLFLSAGDAKGEETLFTLVSVSSRPAASASAMKSLYSQCAASPNSAASCMARVRT